MTTTIPFSNLRAQLESIRPDVDAAIKNVLDSCAFINGPDVKHFEKEFAAYCTAKYCIGISNGTEALSIALQAAGVEQGDGVVTVAHTFMASASAIANLGATPYFVDVDPVTMLMCPKALAQTLKSLATKGVKLKAVVPVHLYGLTCDMDEILKVSREYGLMVIEDGAQAHGAEFEGKRVGTLGDIACFSFYPGKNLGAYGDAGAICSNDEALAKKCAMLRDHGRLDKYLHQILGRNGRIDTIQAAILRVKLPHLESWTEARIRAASLYSQKLSGLSSVICPKTPAGRRHVFHLYVILCERRDELRQHLTKLGIETGIHYPTPLHLQPAFKDLSYEKGDFPVTESLAERILSLPIDGTITEKEIERVSNAIRDFYA